MQNLEKDVEKLTLSSEMAKKHGWKSSYSLIDIGEINERLSFHPNGNCGCILLDDDYAFGIRCNHLIWAEGNCEGTEDFWTEKDRQKSEYDTILIYGNHKGVIKNKLLAFQEF